MVAGVAGYMLKDEATEAVVEAIRTIMRGASWFSHTVVEKLISTRTSSDPLLQLTERERQVLEHLAHGYSNALIAQKLHLAEQTVRNYLSRIYRKLNVSNRTQAIIWARGRGLVQKQPNGNFNNQ